MIEEKRNLRRIRAKVIADCARNSHEKFSAEHFISFTKDISNQGARLLAHKELKPGESIIVSLEIPDYFIPLLVKADIIWAKHLKRQQNGTPSVTEAGVKFIKIDSFDAKKLEAFVNSK